MAFIGNSVQNQGFAPAVDYFNGDGTTVTFTLSRPVASVAQLTAVIENVIQNPTSAFTVSGNQLTFTSAPPAGTNNIWVEYTSLITQYNGISQDPSVVGDITASGGYLSTGDFGNSYLDGTIVDYVTGMSRITTGASDGITLYNGGTSARTALMTISSAGNVGIGTTSPARNLALTSSGNTTLQVTNSTSGTGASDGFIVQQNGLNSFVLNQEAGALYLGTSNAERMTIDSSGNVGIGTSSPNSRLDIRSGSTTFNTQLSSTGTNSYTPTTSTSLVNATLQLVGGGASGATTGIRISQSGSFELYMGGVQESGGAGAFVFQGYSGAAYAERMRIASDGTVTVGGYNVLGVGVAQTWQDVAGSRSLGTTYTNSTGKPIQLGYWVRSTGTTTLTVVISGVTVYTQAVGGVQYVTQIIPIGATYSVSANNISSSAWLELR